MIDDAAFPQRPVVDGLGAVAVGVEEKRAVVVVPILGRGPGEPSSRYPASVPARQKASTSDLEGATKATWRRRVTGSSSSACVSEKSAHSVKFRPVWLLSMASAPSTVS